MLETSNNYATYIFFFFTVKTHNFEQSAGNQQIVHFSNSILVGTSETIRSTHIILWEDIVRAIKYSLIYLDIHNLNYTATRSYSSLTSNYGTWHNTKALKPEKVYNSLKQDRLEILKDQKNKSGVYCLINNINGHAYVGSSINLTSRMRGYLNNTFLKSKQNINMPITKALLKYDQSNFTLIILEYVEYPSLTIRETFYITHVIPYYNVLKQGYFSLGYKHTEEAKRLLRELGKKRMHTDKTKTLIARALTGENNAFYNKSHSIESKIRMIQANSAYPVYVYNSYK